MANKNDLSLWVLEALKELSGAGTIVQIAKVIWEKHKQDLDSSGELFYTWQYDMRWAATNLRKRNLLLAAEVCPQGVWLLKKTNKG